MPHHCQPSCPNKKKRANFYAVSGMTNEVPMLRRDRAIVPYFQFPIRQIYRVTV
jgi:hypothetical protein